MGNEALTKAIAKVKKKNSKRILSKKVMKGEKVSPNSEAKILYLDIENSPNDVLSWGLFNQNISVNQIKNRATILSYAAQWDHDPKGIFDSVQHKSLKKMMIGLWALMDEADIVVTYNGKKFDVPKIHTEFQILGLGKPSRYEPVDLYPIMRASAKHTSNKLEYIVQQFGLGQKVENAGMPLWIGCMENDPESWKIMEKYNRQDTALLKGLYKIMLPWIHAHPNVAIYNIAAGIKLDGKTCPSCGGNHLTRNTVKPYHITKTQMYRAYTCDDCGSYVRERKTCMPKDQRDNILVQQPTS